MNSGAGAKPQLVHRPVPAARMRGMWTEQKIRERLRMWERKLADPSNTDDPNWIQRRIDWLQKRLAHKAKAVEHKQSESRDKRPPD
jgi:hypothetical protein